MEISYFHMNTYFILATQGNVLLKGYKNPILGNMFEIKQAAPVTTSTESVKFPWSIEGL